LAFLLDDEPTIEDRLKWTRGTSIRELGDMIAACSPPTILGARGNWGAGMTRFPCLLRHDLTRPARSTRAYRPGTRLWCVGWTARPNVAVGDSRRETIPVVALRHEIRA
jgi:hypothetical protein